MNYGEYGPSKKARRRGLIGAGVLLVLAVAGGLLVWFIGYTPLPFDRAGWDAERDWRDTTRHRMADSLIASRKLIGMSRGEIIAMLGEPSRAPYFTDGQDIEYWLGPQRSFINIDSEHLVINLGADGRAVETELAVD